MRLRDLLYIPPLPEEKRVHTDDDCAACKHDRQRQRTLAGVVGNFLIDLGSLLGGEVMRSHRQ